MSVAIRDAQMPASNSRCGIASKWLTHWLWLAYCYHIQSSRCISLCLQGPPPFDFYTAPSHAAEIAVAPAGDFVYGSNRGHDSIVTYAVDCATGLLTLKAHTQSGGGIPWHISFAPSAATVNAPPWLVVTNQFGTQRPPKAPGNISVFATDDVTGDIIAERCNQTDLEVGPLFAAVLVHLK
jgi:hypothetical protein